MGTGPLGLLLSAEIARRYFLEGQTKTEIAKEFKLTRFKVARLLEESRESGLVSVEIRLPSSIDPELSERLAQTFGIRRAIVVSSHGQTGPELRGQLAAVTASLLTEIVTADDVLGIGWGRTLYGVPDHLTSLPPCPVVQMNGTVGPIDANSTELVRRVTEVSGGPAYPIYGPLVLPDIATAEGLRRQPGIAEALAQVGNLTKALVAVGSWEPPDSQLRDALSARQRAELAELGVVAEICSTLLAADGTPLPSELTDRAIAPSTDQLREIPELIVAAGGPTKAAALRAVLSGGWAHTVVTDSTAATMLLS